MVCLPMAIFFPTQFKFGQRLAAIIRNRPAIDAWQRLDQQIETKRAIIAGQ